MAVARAGTGAANPASPGPATPAVEVRERLEQMPSWPVTRAASWSLTLLLAAGLYVPAAIAEAHGTRWLLLLAAAVLATMIVRALFEALGFATDSSRVLRHVSAAIPPAFVAGALMACASAIIAPPWSSPAGLATIVLSTATLAIAGTLRGLEIRLRRRLRRVYFIGSSESLRDLERELARYDDRRLVGAATAIERGDPGEADAIAAAVIASRATVLVLDSRAMLAATPAAVASVLGRSGVGVHDLVSYYEQEFKKVPLGELSSAWFAFNAGSPPRRLLHAAPRRALEVLVALVGLLLALPVLLVAAVAIRASSPGPALYRQRRVGKGGATFTVVKLRTMIDDAEGEAAWASSHAHRVTPLGRHLRRFRVDELPQLWDVLRGDLALIGPRPEQVPIVERLSQRVPHYRARHCIRPGLTGWAQVNLGYGGSVDGALAKLQRDLFYVKHRGWRLDALIIWLTLRAVFAGQG